MIGHPGSQPTPPVTFEPTPEPAEITLPIRRRCDNCPRFFTITNRKQLKQRFHSPACRKEFHRNGLAWGPLRDKLTALIGKLSKQNAETAASAAVREELEAFVSSANFIERMKALGFVHQSQLRKVPVKLSRRAFHHNIDTLEIRLGYLGERVERLETSATGRR